MKHQQYRPTKRTGSLPCLLAVTAAVVLGFSSPDSFAKDRGGDPEEKPFDEAHFFIEYNSSAGDTGVQVFLDDANWRRITISDPNGKTLFDVKGKSTLGRQGLTELFFESVEPELAALPLVEFLERFPAGDYEFEGIRNDGIELESEVEFAHVIPCAPEILSEDETRFEDGSIFDPELPVVLRWDEVSEVVDPAATDAAGETVCTDSEELAIDIYQVIVENDDVHLIVDLTSDTRTLTVPPEMLAPDTLYIFEVLAKEEIGNQTITEGFFCTGPNLTPEQCVELAEAL